MIRDPSRRGRALAEFYLTVEPRLFVDLDEAGVLPAHDDPARAERVRNEWACFALYACVRGLIAAGGFNRETGAAIDALHERAMAAWWNAGPGDGGDEWRRTMIADRYAEYGTIGQAGGASAAATVARRLGEAAARHMAEEGPVHGALAETVGSLHETLAEGAAEAVRRAE
ncbi:MAG: hypothetical protein ACRENJ_07060 [Candidatus Eiseniibacteriota bacterium]